jgi:hypothetical protein
VFVVDHHDIEIFADDQVDDFTGNIFFARFKDRMNPVFVDPMLPGA